MIMSSTNRRIFLFDCSPRIMCVLTSFLLVAISTTDATDLNSHSPRVVFTKQGPVQGFLGPGNVGVHYQPQPDGTYAFRHFSGRPIIEVPICFLLH